MSKSSESVNITCAENAIKTLHQYIINPPTSVARAILPSPIADRLQLARFAVSLNSFCRALRNPGPELALISAALPVSYIKAEMTVNAMLAIGNPQKSCSSSECRQQKESTDAGLQVCLSAKSASVKTEIVPMMAELSSSTNSTIQKLEVEGNYEISGDLIQAQRVVGIVGAFIKEKVVSFHGLY